MGLSGSCQLDQASVAALYGRPLLSIPVKPRSICCEQYIELKIASTFCAAVARVFLVAGPGFFRVFVLSRFRDLFDVIESRRSPVLLSVGASVRPIMGFREPKFGVEYLVSGEVYPKMPADEQAYGHDHKFEVEAGLLKSLTRTGDEEKATLAKVRTLYGKIFHTWSSGKTYPQGPARLFWAVTGEEPFVLAPKGR